MSNSKHAYLDHWDEKFKTRSWGKYPNEDLVRFVCGEFSRNRIKNPKVLEIGSGTGANLWFLQNEGLNVSGIDSSKTGIEASKKKLSDHGFNLTDLRVGNFNTLPWEQENFDLVVDIFALYANTVSEINKTVKEIARVLKPGGFFFTTLWGAKTAGYGTGLNLEENTYTDILDGPCKDMGVAHFFHEAELLTRFRPLKLQRFTEINRIIEGQIYAQEYICIYKK